MSEIKVGDIVFGRTAHAAELFRICEAKDGLAVVTGITDKLIVVNVGKYGVQFFNKGDVMVYSKAQPDTEIEELKKKLAELTEKLAAISK